MAKLVVWGALVMAPRDASAACGVPSGRQLRAIALVPSRAAFARALMAAGLGGRTELATSNWLRDFGAETHNDAELGAAKVVGQVLLAPHYGVDRVFIPWPPE